MIESDLLKALCVIVTILFFLGLSVFLTILINRISNRKPTDDELDDFKKIKNQITR